MEAEFVTVSRRDLGYPVLTDYLPFSNQSFLMLEPGSWNCFFILKMPGRFFSFQSRRKKKNGGFVRSQSSARMMEGRRMPGGTKDF